MHDGHVYVWQRFVQLSQWGHNHHLFRVLPPGLELSIASQHDSQVLPSRSVFCDVDTVTASYGTPSPTHSSSSASPTPVGACCSDHTTEPPPVSLRVRVFAPGADCWQYISGAGVSKPCNLHWQRQGGRGGSSSAGSKGEAGCARAWLEHAPGSICSCPVILKIEVLGLPCGETDPVSLWRSSAVLAP